MYFIIHLHNSRLCNNSREAVDQVGLAAPSMRTAMRLAHVWPGPLTVLQWERIIDGRDNTNKSTCSRQPARSGIGPAVLTVTVETACASMHSSSIFTIDCLPEHLIGRKEESLLASFCSAAFLCYYYYYLSPILAFLFARPFFVFSSAVAVPRCLFYYSNLPPTLVFVWFLFPAVALWILTLDSCQLGIVYNYYVFHNWLLVSHFFYPILL